LVNDLNSVIPNILKLNKILLIFDLDGHCFTGFSVKPPVLLVRMHLKRLVEFRFWSLM